jgi:hypothetical protein
MHIQGWFRLASLCVQSEAAPQETGYRDVAEKDYPLRLPITTTGQQSTLASTPVKKVRSNLPSGK